MRYKKMPSNEFQAIADRNWVPVKLSESSWPAWMRGIPREKVEIVLASGTFIDSRILETQGATISDVLGGMDIYRNDPNDLARGFPINKDHYILLLDPESDACLLVAGPFRDNEHWLTELPDLPAEITVIDQLISEE